MMLKNIGIAAVISFITFWSCSEDSADTTDNDTDLIALSPAESPDQPQLEIVDQPPSDIEVIEGTNLPIYGGSAPNQPFHRAVVALHQRYSSGVSFP